MRVGKDDKAFVKLRTSLALGPFHSQALLATASLMQVISPACNCVPKNTSFPPKQHFF